MSQTIQEQISQARDAMLRGEVVILPTETVYGLAVIAQNRDKIYELKSRPTTKHLAHVFSSKEALLEQVKPDRYTEMAINKLLPGPFTLILNTKDGRKIGARVPESEACVQVLRDIPGEILLTSANLHNEFPAMSFTDAKQIFPELIGVDGGECKYSRPSMIIDLTTSR